MKKLAGRDFEDLLQVRALSSYLPTDILIHVQCSIPVFEGLLSPPHDNIVRELLFELATWHGLAKLRLHTDTTINSLEQRLGQAIRNFESETCTQLEARDLPAEDAARARRKLSRLAAGTTTSEPTTQKAKKPREFNMKTYKLHALGHYAKAIRLFGPSDGFSTQTVHSS
jgi:hypothetical protein